MSESTLNVLSERATNKLIDVLLNDEAFRFSRIKTAQKAGRLEVPDYTSDDDESVTTVKSFRASVLFFKKNFYRGESATPGKEPDERAELYLLREGVQYPEQFFVSPTSVARFKQWVASVMRKGQYWGHVLVEVSGDVAKSKSTGFTWTVVDFKTVGPLTDEEIEYTDKIRPAIQERVKKYSIDTEADSLYEKALSGETTAPPSPRNVPLEEDDKPASNGRSRANLSDDDEDEKPASNGRSRANLNDDDEDEKPAPSRRAAQEKEEETPAPSRRRGRPTLTDDEDNS